MYHFVDDATGAVAKFFKLREVAFLQLLSLEHIQSFLKRWLRLHRAHSFSISFSIETLRLRTKSIHQRLTLSQAIAPLKLMLWTSTQVLPSRRIGSGLFLARAMAAPNEDT